MEHKPTDFIIPDQFIDRTKVRISTFFGNGIVGHVAFADPVCSEVQTAMETACQKAKVVGKRGGTYICIEGPQFSTKAESNLYRAWGMDVVGMTNLQEAKLAREAEMCYATLALVTDYDCWHPEHETVTVEMIIANLLQNARTAQQAIAGAVARIPPGRTCGCQDALAAAI